MADRSDMLRKVRAMLAKADSTTEQGEADVFRAKAEELMLKYRIEQHELGTQHADNAMKAEEYDMEWYRGEHGSELWLLMSDVARHCSVKIVHWEFGGWKIPVVGTDADREYFDALFTGIMLEFMKGLEPQPSASKPLIENLVMLKESGQKWKRIAEQLHRIGQLTDAQFTSWDQFKARKEAEGDWPRTSEYEAIVKKQVHHLNFSGQYTNFCKKHNRERLRTTPAIYQRSFKLGFVGRMDERLREIRLAAMKGMTNAESSGMDLVLASNRDRANAKAIELYGPPPAPRGGSAGRARNVRIDMGVVHKGRAAADAINLAKNSGGRVGTGRGELNR